MLASEEHRTQTTGRRPTKPSWSHARPRRVWTKSHTPGTVSSRTRAVSGGTLTTGGGWFSRHPRVGLWVRARPTAWGPAIGLLDLLAGAVLLPSLGQQEFVEVAVARDRGADVARVDGLTGFDEVRDPARLQELGDDTGLGRLLRFCFRRGVTLLDQHPLDQSIDLGQGLCGGVDDQRLERLPLRFPLVAIKAWFDHDKGMRASDPFETLLA